MKSIQWLTLLMLVLPFQMRAQIIFSEVAPTNAYQLADENDDYPDWIEIINSGSSDQNLVGFSLSDNSKPKWTFPDFTLSAGERLLVYASGKEQGWPGAIQNRSLGNSLV
jgi:hypothetical protein